MSVTVTRPISLSGLPPPGFARLALMTSTSSSMNTHGFSEAYVKAYTMFFEVPLIKLSTTLEKFR